MFRSVLLVQHVQTVEEALVAGRLARGRPASAVITPAAHNDAPRHKVALRQPTAGNSQQFAGMKKLLLQQQRRGCDNNTRKLHRRDHQLQQQQQQQGKQQKRQHTCWLRHNRRICSCLNDAAYKLQHRISALLCTERTELRSAGCHRQPSKASDRLQ